MELLGWILIGILGVTMGTIILLACGAFWYMIIYVVWAWIEERFKR